MAEVIINGQEYSFADVRVNILGRSVEGLRGVRYNTTRDHQNVKGRGARNVAMAKGGKDHEGSVSLLQSEVEAIQRSLSPGKDLTDIPPFPIVVAYAPEDGTATTDILEGCRFRAVPKNLTVEDANQTIELELAIFNIRYNV